MCRRRRARRLASERGIWGWSWPDDVAFDRTIAYSQHRVHAHTVQTPAKSSTAGERTQKCPFQGSAQIPLPGCSSQPGVHISKAANNKPRRYCASRRRPCPRGRVSPSTTPTAPGRPRFREGRRTSEHRPCHADPPQFATNMSCQAWRSRRNQHPPPAVNQIDSLVTACGAAGCPLERDAQFACVRSPQARRNPVLFPSRPSARASRQQGEPASTMRQSSGRIG